MKATLSRESSQPFLNPGKGDTQNQHHVLTMRCRLFCAWWQSKRELDYCCVICVKSKWHHWTLRPPCPPMLRWYWIVMKNNRNRVVAKRLGARGKKGIVSLLTWCTAFRLGNGTLGNLHHLCVDPLYTKPAFKVWNRNWYSLSASLRSMVKWPRSHLICMMHYLLLARFNTDVLILLWHDSSKGPLKSVWACTVFQHDFLLHNYFVCLSFICLSHFPSVRVLILTLFFSC